MIPSEAPVRSHRPLDAADVPAANSRGRRPRHGIHGRFMRSAKIQPDSPRHLSLDRYGLARFHTADLQAIGIDGQATIMIDVDTRRIGLRRPRDGEAEQTAIVRPVRDGGKLVESRRTINLRPAIEQIGIEPAEITGRYELTAKDDLLILALA